MKWGIKGPHIAKEKSNLFAYLNLNREHGLGPSTMMILK